ncbi:hypothetical protein RJ641_009160 [Dillenia turbinata]|uniref:Complex I assembly factor TIMMDC1, mitochondrial n=1 Tax=Dillenia turbinata TaxID=194707 RepID=A0AAN8V1K6_9MAGN
MEKGRTRLPGTVNWGTAAVIGVFAGMLSGGSKEAAASVVSGFFLFMLDIAKMLKLKLGSAPDKREQCRLMRDAMEKRFLSLTSGSIVGGVRLGIFTAAFFGLQDLFAEKRGVHDVFNVAGAGSLTAATFLRGSLAWRAGNVLLDSVLGAAVCFPLGWIHLKLVDKVNEEIIATKAEADEIGEIKRGVGAAIERLEGGLTK